MLFTVVPRGRGEKNLFQRELYQFDFRIEAYIIHILLLIIQSRAQLAPILAFGACSWSSTRHSQWHLLHLI